MHVRQKHTLVFSLLNFPSSVFALNINGAEMSRWWFELVAAWSLSSPVTAIGRVCRRLWPRCASAWRLIPCQGCGAWIMDMQTHGVVQALREETFPLAVLAV